MTYTLELKWADAPQEDETINGLTFEELTKRMPHTCTAQGDMIQHPDFESLSYVFGLLSAKIMREQEAQR